MKFKKCFLHIGSEKTGTTSLQEFLKINSEALAEQSYFIPKSMGPNEHIDLVCLFANSNKTFSRRRRLGLKNASQIDNHRQELSIKINEEMSKAANPSDILIISSERLFTVISDYDEITSLKNFLLKFCEQIEIIAYIRPQHEFALSIYSTALKNGSKEISCFPPIKEGTQRGRSYNYYKVLSFWQSHFRDSNLSVRKFQKKSLVDGDTIKDFSKLTGIQLTGLVIPKNHNVTLNAQAQMFLQHFNKYIPAANSKSSSIQRGNVNKILTNNFSGPGQIPDKAKAVEFYEQFKSSNESVRKEWFASDAHLFDITFNKYPETSQIVSLPIDKCFELFAKIYMVNTNKIAKLSKQVTEN